MELQNAFMNDYQSHRFVDLDAQVCRLIAE